MNQSRKTRQPDRFMLYMTLTLLLWVVVFVVVLLTQVTNPVGTPPVTDASRPDAPRNPFSSGQFASPENSQFTPRPRRLDPVQLPPARAYTSIVFGDASFNVTNPEINHPETNHPEINNFAAQPPVQLPVQPPQPSALATDLESALPDISSNPADTTSNITDPTNAASVIDTIEETIGAEDGNYKDSSDVADTPPATSLEVIANSNTAVSNTAVSNTAVSNQTSTPQDNTDVTADDTRRVANITPPEQTDIASAHADTAKAEGMTADTALGVSNASTAVTTDTTDTTTAANSTSTFPEDIRLEPPPLLPTHPAPATADLITVTFSSQPSGAEVIVEDEVIGTTPLELRLPANQDIFYTLAVPSSSSGTSGFRRFSSVVRSPEDTAVAVQLEPISNVPTASIEGFGTVSALRGNRANALVVRDAVATLLEQAVTEYQAAISDSRIARLQAEIDALEAELARLDAILATSEEPTDR